MPEDLSILQDEEIQAKRPIRSRNGCLTCRRRKKKCDESRPSCAGCQRNHLECQWESSDSLLKPRRRYRRPSLAENSNSLPEEIQRRMNIFFVLTPDLVYRLLGHFLDDSPKWLSTRTGSRRTDYLKWLSPAISNSPLVLNCILAIASADLLKYDRGSREIRRVAVEYYGKAVSGLRTAINDEMAIASPSYAFAPDYTPLAVLLLCVHETQNFTESERILPHLNAAVFLLQNRISHRSTDIGMRGFLFETFCYFFSLASFSLGSKLPLFQASRIFNEPMVIEHLRTGHIMGTSQHLFIAIYRVSSLAQTLTSGNPKEVSVATSELASLDEDLASKHPRPDFGHNMNIEDLNDAVTSELYRLACRIHIKKLLVSSAPDEESAVFSMVEDFIDKLRLLPSNSPSQSILSWPLVVAGFSATTSGQQRIIVAKLAQIHDEWQSAIFSKGAAYLQEKWRRDKYLNHCHHDSDSTSSSTRSRQTYDEIRTTWEKCPVILA